MLKCLFRTEIARFCRCSAATGGGLTAHIRTSSDDNFGFAVTIHESLGYKKILPHFSHPASQEHLGAAVAR
jgi:hypothetical protein